VLAADRGALHFLPEQQGSGYNVGYGGGGSTELARMIEKIVRSDGHLVPGTPNEMPDARVLGWVSSKAADRTQELTLDQLKLLCRTGMGLGPSRKRYACQYDSAGHSGQAARASSRRERWLVRRGSRTSPFHQASRRMRLSAVALTLWSRLVLASPR